MDIDDLIYVMAKQVDQYGTASDMEIVSCLTELKELRAKLAAMESQAADKPAVAVPDGRRIFPRYLSTEARIKWKQRWSKEYSANPDAMWTLFWESVSNDEAPFAAAPSHSQQSSEPNGVPSYDAEAGERMENYCRSFGELAPRFPEQFRWQKLYNAALGLPVTDEFECCPSHESEQQRWQEAFDTLPDDYETGDY